MTNYNRAKQFYNKSENSHNQVKDPLDMVRTMVLELNKSMKIVVECIKSKDKHMLKSKHFSKSLIIIYTLQTTLDFDKGGKLATQLFQLYEYCRQQLLKGFTKNIYDNILKAIDSLDELFINKENGETEAI